MRLLEKLGTLDWEEWLLGLWTAFISGGASAVVAGFVVGTADPNGDFSPMHLRFYMLMGAVFLASGLLNLMAFLRQKPAPDHRTVTTTVQTIQRDPPMTTVVTSVAETHTEPIKSQESPKP